MPKSNFWTSLLRFTIVTLLLLAVILYEMPGCDAKAPSDIGTTASTATPQNNPGELDFDFERRKAEMNNGHANRIREMNDKFDKHGETMSTMMIVILVVICLIIGIPLIIGGIILCVVLSRRRNTGVNFGTRPAYIPPQNNQGGIGYPRQM